MEGTSEAFLYLAVLTSIIFGLAIQQVLLGYRDLILTRTRNRLFAPVLTWSVLILLIVAQNWWESFGLAGRSDWNFVAFGMILLQALIIYMLAAVIFPRTEGSDPIDLKDHYFRERRAIYGIAIAYVVSSPLRALIVDGAILPALDLAYHGLFLAIFVMLAIVARTVVHQLFVPALLAGFIGYIALMTPVLAGG
ncbi:hypothetical protein AAG612_02805 [Citromicrobium bathyomarinum]|uniref:hypothetical protein n=1 Tax=Citromicrobium bathyomarinum TaxID=72174 RepID=UPI003159EE99